LAAVGSEEKIVRLAALRVLPQIGNASVVPTLTETLGDPDREIAQAALASLASLPGLEVDAAVVALLSSAEAGLRLTAVELVGRRRLTAALPALLKAAGEAEPPVRVAALQKLGELGGADELPALINLLVNSQAPEETEAAEQALSALCGRADDPEACTEKLIGTLAEAPPAPKSALLRVLGSVGGTRALSAVRAAVKDPDAEVRAAAIRVLGEWKTAEAAPDLLELAQTSPNPTEKLLCLRAYISLAANQDLPSDQRLDLCKQAATLIQRDEEKKLLLGVLGSLTTVESLALVTPYLDHAATQEEASAAAVAIAEKLVQEGLASKVVEALQKVVQVTKDADLSKRAQALLQQAQSKATGK
jgi:HEAT repeat protein